MSRIIIYHSGYGCETGCCGHYIEVDDKRVGDFNFSHPDSNSDEDRRAFAEQLVTEQLGHEHVRDLD